jgi:predicted kinase
MPAVHLISGLPCSGKTTYATRLQADVDCALFSLDRWLITLFGQYSIDAVGHEEHTRRVLACRELIWSSCAELLRRSVDVILDDGFFLREHRMRCAQLAQGLGASATIHFVDTPLAVVRARLERRNASLPPHNFHVSVEMLEAFEGLFEVPSEQEGAKVVVVKGAMWAGESEDFAIDAVQRPLAPAASSNRLRKRRPS